jgi:hypothetical protein
MTELTPPPYYPPPPAGWQPPVPYRTTADLTWQDLMACITAFFGFSLVALLFGLHSRDQAKKLGLKMHAVGMVGLIFGAIGTAAWTLLLLLVSIGMAAS